MNPGLVYTALAFVSWGLFPLYFHVIAHVAPLEVVLHRSVWTLVFVAGLLAVQRRNGHGCAPRAATAPLLAVFAVSALLLAGNWLVYVYAVQTGQVVEASLGYYINPLFSVLLGCWCCAKGCARRSGQRWRWPPRAWPGSPGTPGRCPGWRWCWPSALRLYGLMRKTASLGALEGLALENMLLAPVALPLLLWWTLHATAALAQGDPVHTGLAAAQRAAHRRALLLFAAGARRIAAGHRGHGAVHVAQPSAAAGRVGVRRGLSTPRACWLLC
jgi:chloramphenicol-sensitive protein RarD